MGTNAKTEPARFDSPFIPYKELTDEATGDVYLVSKILVGHVMSVDTAGKSLTEYEKAVLMFLLTVKKNNKYMTIKEVQNMDLKLFSRISKLMER